MMRPVICRLAALLSVMAWLCCHAHAQEAARDVPLPDAAQEAQARSLFHELRCEVCQGQNIGDSNAALATDMRRLVRQRLAAGDAPEDIRRYLAERYGESILMRPPVSARTLPLWFAPVLLLVGGGVLLLRFYRRKGKAHG